MQQQTVGRRHAAHGFRTGLRHGVMCEKFFSFSHCYDVHRLTAFAKWLHCTLGRSNCARGQSGHAWQHCDSTAGPACRVSAPPHPTPHIPHPSKQSRDGAGPRHHPRNCQRLSGAFAQIEQPPLSSTQMRMMTMMLGTVALIACVGLVFLCFLYRPLSFYAQFRLGTLKVIPSMCLIDIHSGLLSKGPECGGISWGEGGWGATPCHMVWR